MSKIERIDGIEGFGFEDDYPRIESTEDSSVEEAEDGLGIDDDAQARHADLLDAEGPE